MISNNSEKIRFNFYLSIGILLLISQVLTACDINPNTPSLKETITPSRAIPSQTPYLLTLPASSSTTTVNSISPKNNFTPTISQTFNPTLAYTISGPNDWSFRWIKGIPCQPPCWEGVTPGITKAEEAEQIFRNNSLLKSVGIIYPDNKVFQNLGFVEWNWAIGGSGPKNGEAVFYKDDINHTIFRIHPIYKDQFRLKDVIQAYGQPSHVVTTVYLDSHTGHPSFYELTIIYLPLGFSLYYNKLVPPQINENLVMETPIFFTRNKPELLEGAFLQKDAKLVQWQGFKDFDFYLEETKKANN
jgi:hypothetical protein